MTLTSKINGKTKKDKEFKNILLSVEPEKEHYYTHSGKTPFSEEYITVVPNELKDQQRFSSLLGVAFDYLARFRIAQFLSREDVVDAMNAVKGFRKIRIYQLRESGEFLEDEYYFSLKKKVLEFINDSTQPISSICEEAVRLAKFEQINRMRVKGGSLNFDYLLIDSAPLDVVNELDRLMSVFEEKFMVPEIINEKSKVVFNPEFGAGSSLVDGADADIYIDGTLYDFKTTKDKSLKKNDNLQLIGYYLLNEIALKTLSEYDFNYTRMDIKRLAFYKARFGETEYYDVCSYLPYDVRLKQKLKEIAIHFKDKKIRPPHLLADIEEVQEILEEIRNWDFEEELDSNKKYMNLILGKNK
ncbi:MULTISPECIES: hypothetical protein [Bacillus]|uniref:hypothetical protein n=1 Tax=Bacillus TaxID=1386 RepID=UPI001320AC03|nr:hypothetical protein [Bacillus licheniformis]MCU9959305.1 hypothetical protein [Bacillus licheniformis]MED1028861.1 hypothetical protein [Bacillus licheniformis]MED1102566.1 hypothetical protein [Bacillus licheniformis]TWN17879.1 hypothetical protein CHCC14562_2716 [Bacillus licheniformis]TWN28205.1 hypothetical protein CHCC14559_2432 [Bacillus licheniformis]